MDRRYSAVLLFAALFPFTANAAVPVLYCTDLNHPHGDPDDHFDLATLFALEEFDIRGIVLDNVIPQDAQPGAIPVRQMFHLSGRDVPLAVGLTRPLASPEDDGRGEEARFQAGVVLILKTLAAADEPVTIITAGALRDVAAAFNRDPESFRKKVDRLYINIGFALRDGDTPEYNVGLDPRAYARIMGSGLPVYWCPCFSGKVWQSKEGYATFWQFDHKDVLPRAPRPLQNFFLFALAKPEGADPIAYLAAEPDLTQREEIWRLRRNMWCTAPFFHAAGRAVYRVASGDYAALAARTAERLGVADHRVGAYTFEPARVEVLGFVPSKENGPVQVNVEFESSEPNLHVFRQTDAAYQDIMTSCLKRLFMEFPLQE